MKKKGNLFSLVKSLSEQEKKRFISDATKTAGTKSYIKLFHFISSNPEISDEHIRHHFEGEKFLNQLHVIKNYLYNQLLNSLRQFHGNKSVGARIKNALIDVEILYKKELFYHCHYELQKAKKLALQYEKKETLLEILRWERTLLNSPMHQNKDLEGVRKVINDEYQITHDLSNYNKYLRLSYNELSGGFTPEKLDQILESGLVNRDISGDPLQTKILHYHVLYVGRTFQGNTSEGINALSMLVEEIEQHPLRIREDPKPLITALNNKIGALLYLRQHLEIPFLLEKIRSIPNAYEIPIDNYLRRSMARSYNMEMELYRDTGQVDKGLELIPQVHDFLHNNMSMLPDEYMVILYYQFAYINFVANHYSTSLKYINEIVNHNFGSTREDIQCYSRLLNLIVHYELRNITVLKYSVQATRRFLQKKKFHKAFGTNILKLFSRLCTTPVADHPHIFKNALQNIFKDTTRQDKASILDYLNFEQWLHANVSLKLPRT